MENIKEIIRNRRSVRTYDGDRLSTEDTEKLTKYLESLDNPFGVKVEFRFLDAKEHKVSSPVIVGTDSFIAAKVSVCPQFEIAYGYTFEKFCLYAQSLGIGTVMLAGTLSRRTFEKAMELKDNEVMPVASPVGYPADKMSLREKMMRSTVKADARQPFDKLFFKNSFENSLTPEEAGQFSDALEMTRLAPSAMNKQPWRAVVCGDTVHFFKVKSKAIMSDGTLNLQKIDMGIALAHFDLTLQEQGVNGTFVAENHSIENGDDFEYVISYKV